MFLQILRRDLKRKKTMNIILLLFVIIASMFTASSVNNILAVTKGLDYFAERSEIHNYDRMIVSDGDPDDLNEVLASKDFVEYYETEELGCLASWNDITLNGEKLKESSDLPYIMSIDNAVLNYFDEHNNTITEIGQGRFYANVHTYRNTTLKTGDKVRFTVGDRTAELEYAGAYKDIIFGSELTASPRMLVNGADYDALFKGPDSADLHKNLCFVKSTDDNAVVEAISSLNCLSYPMSLLRTCFVLNMVVAYILLAASVGLMIVSLAILRFTISFTISEDFREIGVMKALGINNSGIRGLYLTKYFAISIAGAVIGFFLSIPFANMMLKSVSEVMCLGNTDSTIAGVLCSAAIVLIILAFCFGCTGRIKKLSPIDAVRNGQTGERFGKRSIMHLGRSRLPATGFLAVNDIFSSPKQFGMVAAILTLCMLLVMLVSNLITSMKSGEMIKLVGPAAADAYFTYFDTKEGQNYDKVDGGGELFADSLEKTLADNGMPAKCTFNYILMRKTEHNGKALSVRYLFNPLEDMNSYTYDEGYAPQDKDEVALSWGLLGDLGVKVGDHVKISTAEGELDCMVTAAFSSINNSGKLGILYNGSEVSHEEITGSFGANICFDGNPAQEQTDANIARIKEIYDTEEVYNSTDFATKQLGIGNTLEAVKYLLITVTVIIVLLITILIERSFIAKEKSDIALMKALGTQNSSIIAQHSLRFVLIAVIVCVAASFASIPLTERVLGPILSMVGKVQYVPSSFDPMDIFVINPVILLSATTLGAFLTALYTRTITANDAAGIE